MSKSDKVAHEIIIANFWENWKFYEELCKMNSPKRFAIKEEVEKIRLQMNKIIKNE